eukprot:g4214.t1
MSAGPHDSPQTSPPDRARAFHRRNTSRSRGMSLEEGAECGLAQSLFDDLAFIKGDGSDVFIMNLHSSIDSQQLYETFSNFGAIADCKVPLDERGHSKRCGVIRFFDRKDADEVVEKVNA